MQLEQVVGAVEAPLTARRSLAAQQQPAARLDRVELAEDGLDDHVALGVGGATLLRPQLARHALLGRGRLGDGPAQRGQRLLAVLELARGEVGVEPALCGSLDVSL
jgi:hypothetical protein